MKGAGGKSCDSVFDFFSRRCSHFFSVLLAVGFFRDQGRVPFAGDTLEHVVNSIGGEAH